MTIELDFYELDTPENLKWYNWLDKNCPQMFYKKYENKIDELKKRENRLAKILTVHIYAQNMIKGRWS